MSDILLSQTPDDGDITVQDGTVAMTNGNETAVYMSLFGGQEKGGVWWGDVFETVEVAQSTSRTQALLQSLPIVPKNLLRLKDAIEKDLEWMSPKPSIEITIPALNRIQIKIDDLLFIWGAK